MLTEYNERIEHKDLPKNVNMQYIDWTKKENGVKKSLQIL
jgi:hypothetical protein